ncbi:hypothetical protein IE4872_PB00139 (plasmid) [Rhizobium gallicum]|uniref:Uncharacterized protein n=2 Tax=Rhizobium gallicum TaxID=56730 RepID=A0A0B4XA83_9HYPH|nr:hypothetical protein RGR602_PA00173 [Rhizobium gallicum bv. gallicum R602sp]APO70010.1 hypothetical protein IE4872_PB00139 [Rhizobium gallicum]
MLLLGDLDTALCLSFSRLHLSEDISRTAERAVGCNCGRAFLSRRISGARSPAKTSGRDCERRG